jgi:hypothetical protein
MKLLFAIPKLKEAFEKPQPVFQKPLAGPVTCRRRTRRRLSVFASREVRPEVNMDRIVSTVFFDGRFWIALIERTGPDGAVSVGRHTFGPEPTNNDLIAFYLNTAHLVPTYKSDALVRPKKAKPAKAQERGARKSFAAFKEIQKASLTATQKASRSKTEAAKDELHRKKVEKRKQKKRGR